jgi:hypothetical protein
MYIQILRDMVQVWKALVKIQKRTIISLTRNVSAA